VHDARYFSDLAFVNGVVIMEINQRVLTSGMVSSRLVVPYQMQRVHLNAV
jgi:hypothetical protein